jgi:hypothetical protein
VLCAWIGASHGEARWESDASRRAESLGTALQGSPPVVSAEEVEKGAALEMTRSLILGLSRTYGWRQPYVGPVVSQVRSAVVLTGTDVSGLTSDAQIMRRVLAVHLPGALVEGPGWEQGMCWRADARRALLADHWVSWVVDEIGSRWSPRDAWRDVIAAECPGLAQQAGASTDWSVVVERVWALRHAMSPARELIREMPADPDDAPRILPDGETHTGDGPPEDVAELMSAWRSLCAVDGRGRAILHRPVRAQEGDIRAITGGRRLTAERSGIGVIVRWAR